jgi:hypothetical protein
LRKDVEELGGRKGREGFRDGVGASKARLKVNARRKRWE